MAQIIIEDAGDSLDPDLLRAKMNTLVAAVLFRLSDSHVG